MSNNGHQIATTILEQLGGNKFIAMTGAKNLVHGEHHLQFKIGRGARNKATHVRIELLADDSAYSLMFYKIRGTDMRTVGEFSVIPENLREAFTRETGFDCTLGTMGRK